MRANLCRYWHTTKTLRQHEQEQTVLVFNCTGCDVASLISHFHVLILIENSVRWMAPPSM